MSRLPFYDPLGYSCHQLLTVVETPTFTRRCEALLTSEERDALMVVLASHPEAGELIVGTGGVRKLRFAAKGAGKSGGVRVVYYFFDRGEPLYALLIYGKNERADLTPQQRKSVSAFARAIKQSRQSK